MQGAITEGHTRGWATTATPFPTCRPPPWQPLGEVPIWAGSPIPQATASSACTGSRVLSAATTKTSLDPAVPGQIARTKAASGISPGNPRPKQEAADAGRGWELKRGVRRADLGGGLYRDNQRGHQRGALRLEVFLEEVLSALEIRCRCWEVHEGWATTATPSPTCQSPPPHTVEGPQPDTATSCLCLLHRVPTHTPGWLLYLSPARVSALISQSAAFSFHLHPLSLGQGTDAWVCPTCIYGAKTKAEHQGLWD